MKKLDFWKLLKMEISVFANELFVYYLRVWLLYLKINSIKYHPLVVNFNLQYDVPNVLFTALVGWDSTQETISHPQILGCVSVWFSGSSYSYDVLIHVTFKTK